MNWQAVKPDWITEHGTVLVLLGNTTNDDTVLGDPDRAESDIKGVSSYLNRRLWEIPEGVQVGVDELDHTGAAAVAAVRADGSQQGSARAPHQPSPDPRRPPLH